MTERPESLDNMKPEPPGPDSIQAQKPFSGVSGQKRFSGLTRNLIAGRLAQVRRYASPTSSRQVDFAREKQARVKRFVGKVQERSPKGKPAAVKKSQSTWQQMDMTLSSGSSLSEGAGSSVLTQSLMQPRGGQSIPPLPGGGQSIPPVPASGQDIPPMPTELSPFGQRMRRITSGKKPDAARPVKRPDPGSRLYSQTTEVTAKSPQKPQFQDPVRTPEENRAPAPESKKPELTRTPDKKENAPAARKPVGKSEPHQEANAPSGTKDTVDAGKKTPGSPGIEQPVVKPESSGKISQKIQRLPGSQPETKPPVVKQKSDTSRREPEPVRRAEPEEGTPDKDRAKSAAPQQKKSPVPDSDTRTQITKVDQDTDRPVVRDAARRTRPDVVRRLQDEKAGNDESKPARLAQTIKQTPEPQQTPADPPALVSRPAFKPFVRLSGKQGKVLGTDRIVRRTTSPTGVKTEERFAVIRTGIRPKAQIARIDPKSPGSFGDRVQPEIVKPIDAGTGAQDLASKSFEQRSAVSKPDRRTPGRSSSPRPFTLVSRQIEPRKSLRADRSQPGADNLPYRQPEKWVSRSVANLISARVPLNYVQRAADTKKTRSSARQVPVSQDRVETHKASKMKPGTTPSDLSYRSDVQPAAIQTPPSRAQKRVTLKIGSIPRMAPPQRLHPGPSPAVTRSVGPEKPAVTPGNSSKSAGIRQSGYATGVLPERPDRTGFSNVVLFPERMAAKKQPQMPAPDFVLPAQTPAQAVDRGSGRGSSPGLPAGQAQNLRDDAQTRRKPEMPLLQSKTDAGVKDTVQRSLETGASTPQETPAAQPEASAPEVYEWRKEEEVVEPMPDLATLARKVFPIIRQMLEVEKERISGRRF